MKKELNSAEKELKQSKVLKNISIYAGAVAAVSGLTVGGLALCDANFDHTAEICPLTHILGAKHQVAKINEVEGFEAIYNDSKTYDVEKQIASIKYEPYQTIRSVTKYRTERVYETVTVAETEQVYETKQVQTGLKQMSFKVPEVVTEYMQVSCYDNVTMQETYSANDNEIIIIDLESKQLTKKLNIK